MAQTKAQAKSNLTKKRTAAKKKATHKKKMAARKRGEANVKARSQGRLRDVDSLGGEGSLIDKIIRRRNK